MKLSLTMEADTVSVLALSGGRISVDIDGIELAALIDVVCDNDCTLQIAGEPGKSPVNPTLPPFTALPGICCSTAHITEEDNSLLYTLSHQDLDFGESEWIHYSGSGYLIRLEAWPFPVLRLKRLGLSKTCRRLLLTLIRRYAVGIVHLDAFGELLPGFTVFEW